MFTLHRIAVSSEDLSVLRKSEQCGKGRTAHTPGERCTLMETQPSLPTLASETATAPPLSQGAVSGLLSAAAASFLVLCKDSIYRNSSPLLVSSYINCHSPACCGGETLTCLPLPSTSEGDRVWHGMFARSSPGMACSAWV